MLESLRAAYAHASNAAEKKQVAMKVQSRIAETGVIGILGQFFEPVAYSSKVLGITTPIQFYWNMSIDQ